MASQAASPSRGAVPTWHLEAGSLSQLWDGIFPRIVASYWRFKYFEDKGLDNPLRDIGEAFWMGGQPGDDQQTRDEGDRFRKTVLLQKYGFVFPAALKLYVDERLTQNYILTSHELILPKPLRISADDECVSEVVGFYEKRGMTVPPRLPHFADLHLRLPSQAFMDALEILPRGGDPCPYQDERIQQSGRGNTLVNVQAELLQRGDQPTWSLSSKDTNAILSHYNNVVADVWGDDDKYEDSRRDTSTFLSYLMDYDELRDLINPDAAQVNPNGRQIIFTSDYIEFPFPQRPETMLDLYNTWASGEAGIPTFTKTI